MYKELATKSQRDFSFLTAIGSWRARSCPILR